MATIGKGNRRLTPRQFYRAYMRYAGGAFHRVNISRWVILAQWAHETGWGSSNLAVNHNNLAGIRWYGRPGQHHQVGGKPGVAGTGFASYRDLDEFVDDYCYVLGLSYYRRVRAEWDPDDSSERVIIAQCVALGRSPYSAEHYGGADHPGANLIAVWRRLQPVAKEIHDTGTLRP